LFAAVCVDSVQIALQVLVDADKWPWSPVKAAVILGAMNLAAFVARFIAQPNLPRDSYSGN